jgi:DNA-binding transcriptional MerR regulator
MTSDVTRTYRTRAFAALAGVTPRTLRHYDRLGLLKPRRSPAGYRLYTERDLETLEEIVALKFIGVPLKEIAAIRRRATGPFVELLRAQLDTLRSRRRVLTRAIDAIAAAEASLRAGATADAQLIRRLIEVMHMDEQREDTITAYTALLKAKTAFLASLSDDQKLALRQRWTTLVGDVRESLGEDPAGPKAQALLDRWTALLKELRGPLPPGAPAPDLNVAFQSTSELREEVWARRSEWLPPDAAEQAAAIGSAEEALARVRAMAENFPGADVMDFIQRARAARR